MITALVLLLAQWTQESALLEAFTLLLASRPEVTYWMEDETSRLLPVKPAIAKT